MTFGILGWTGPGMRQVVGFGDRSTERVLLGANLGRAIVTNGTVAHVRRKVPIGAMWILRRTCATVPRRGSLSKLLWADLFMYQPRGSDAVWLGTKPRA